MEAQMHRPHEESQPPHHAVVEGEDHHHHQGKKSVMKRVKAKAKKIKDSIKQGLGHEHELDEHGNNNNGSDQEEEEEIVEDPEVHGAPIYDSYVIKSKTIPQQEILGGKSDVINLENPTTKAEDRYGHPRVAAPAAADHGGEDVRRETVGSLLKPEQSSQSQPAVSTPRFGKAYDGGGGVSIGAPSGLQEDPQGPKDRPEAMQPSNYQSKVSDDTGQRGEEAGVPSMVHSFGKLSVEEEKETEAPYTGSHDQFSPQPKGELSPCPLPTSSDASESVETTPKHSEEMAVPPPHDLAPSSGQGSYTGKISTAASSIADKAVSAKNVVASKLGYGSAESHDSDDVKPSEQSSYTEKISSATSAIADKAATAKNVVASKLGYGSGGVGTQGDGDKGVNDKGVSVKAYLAEKFRPGEEDKALSEVISDKLQNRQKEAKPLEKVTESAEVAERLGTGSENPREGEDAVVAGSESSGDSVVEKIKGAVTSWLGKGDESQTNHGSPGDAGSLG